MSVVYRQTSVCWNLAPLQFEPTEPTEPLCLGLGFRFICLENMVGVSGLSSGGTISKTSNERNRQATICCCYFPEDSL